MKPNQMECYVPKRVSVSISGIAPRGVSLILRHLGTRVSAFPCCSPISPARPLVDGGLWTPSVSALRACVRPGPPVRARRASQSPPSTPTTTPDPGPPWPVPRLSLRHMSPGALAHRPLLLLSTSTSSSRPTQRPTSQVPPTQTPDVLVPSSSSGGLAHRPLSRLPLLPRASVPLSSPFPQPAPPVLERLAKIAWARCVSLSLVVLFSA
jgi:hypothetical protein